MVLNFLWVWFKVQGVSLSFNIAKNLNKVSSHVAQGVKVRQDLVLSYG